MNNAEVSINMKKKSFAAKILILVVFLCAITAGAALAFYTVSSDKPTDSATDSIVQIPVEFTVGAVSSGDISQGDVSSSDLLEIPETEPESSSHSVTLMAVGDNLMHMGVVYTGRQADGSYNFECLYAGISDFLDKADVKIINQETIMAGNELGFSGYPHFNSPTELADSISSVGFNVVLQATNHTADQGLQGMQNCISLWEKHPEVLMVGLHNKEENDSERTIPLLTVEDVTFAILNYTYGPNAEVLPSSMQGCLDMLCAYDSQSGAIDFTTLNPQVTEDIRRARELADVVVVCPHWGTEYSTEVSSYQKTFAMQMTEAGADLIIGTHPHVVEPVEWLEAENGNRALCFYSIGNYVSTQKDPISMLEAMAWVTFDVDENGVSISEETSGAIPLVCDYSSSPVRIRKVCPLENYTAEDAAAHGIRSYGYGALTLEDLEQWRDEILGDFVLHLEDIDIY
jgi:poly-gamma-glutamate synthesis protein (capsule biosynthesis protein)